MKRNKITIQFLKKADMWRTHTLENALKEAYGSNVGSVVQSIIFGQVMIYVTDLTADDIIAVTDMIGLSKAREVSHIEPIPLPH